MNEPTFNVTVTHQSHTLHIVAIRTRGRHSPIASCGSADRAEIVRAALQEFAASHGDELAAALDASPLCAVPGGDPEVHMMREKGDATWSVVTGQSVASGLPWSRAAARLFEQVRTWAGRAVIVYRDGNGLCAHTDETQNGER